MKTLDLDTVMAFVLVADLHSFTRAAQAAGTTQSAVSLKLKRLEQRLGRRLVERTPRAVRLSDHGLRFLEDARALLAAHERALAGSDGVRRRLVLGISEHAVGVELPQLLARINTHDPNLTLEVCMGFSRALLDAFDQGAFDAVIVRREAGRRDGEKLLRDPFGWFAAPESRQADGEPLRMVTLAAPCGVRATATRALDAAGVKWNEVFVGSGLAAVAAALASGLGVAALARRLAPPGSVDVAARFRLPKLPASDVMLHSRVSDPATLAALRTLAAAFRAAPR